MRSKNTPAVALSMLRVKAVYLYIIRLSSYLIQILETTAFGICAIIPDYFKLPGFDMPN